MPEFFGRYELRELLGRGGMGEVYRAYDTERRREVALKLLPAGLVADAQFTARFQRESLLAAQLSEPHIVPIHDFGEIDGRLYIDMRIVEGEDLGDLLRSRGPLPARIAVDVVAQVAAALDAAHGRGLVHRDVKPSNIMLTALTPTLNRAPFAYLVDFGIARASDQLTALTTTSSSAVGTLAYMAPERISGEEFDARSDVYALACVLYEALTASMPFTGDTVALMYSHLTREPPRPSRTPGVPVALDEVVARGMAKDPRERYPTAGALADAATAALGASADTGPSTWGPATTTHANPPAAPTQPRTPPPVPPGATTAYGPPPVAPGPPPMPAPSGHGKRGRRAALVAAVVVAAAIGVGVPLALNRDSGGSGGPTGTSSNSTSANALAPGGTLHYAMADPVTTWDPQSIVRTRDGTIASRLFVRTLTQLGADDGRNGPTLTGDLATDTGEANSDGTAWTFTLRTGLQWEDGSELTCADVKYGVSRNFATTTIKAGTGFAVKYLAASDGTSSYAGPYAGIGNALYDRAVVCDGQKITFHLQRPVTDFNYAVSLPEFAPYKKERDRRGTAPFAIFSDGPYRLSGAWDGGGTFVRNENYDPKTDDATIRRALPDKIVVTDGATADAIYSSLFADTGDGTTTVTADTVPRTALDRAGGLPERFTSAPASFVNFVVPNVRRLTDPRIRRALAVATDRIGYISAQGGTRLASPVYGIVPPWVGKSGGYRAFRAFDVSDHGDATQAKSLLLQAGVSTPPSLTFVLRSEAPTSVVAGVRALIEGWNNAGFKVTLKLLPDSSYGPLVEDPANAGKWDLTVLAWGPSYFTAATIIPSVFDSRINLTAGGNGADLGGYTNEAVNAGIDDALSTRDAIARSARWAALDQRLATEVAYIALDNPRFTRLRGSRVTNYMESTATSGFPDLGQIGVRS